MKKISIYLLLLIMSLVFVGCTKTPFVEEKPLDGASLVYVYVMPDNSINDTDRVSYFEVEIDGHLMEDKIYPQEYLKYNLKASSVDVSIFRNQIEKKSLKLSLTKGETYYLKVTSVDNSFGKFDFELVPKVQALKEIKLTRYAVPKEGKPLDILITKEKIEKEQQAKQINVSKTKAEKIKEAHQLKEEGIITQQEFEKLKAEIINAN